MVFERGEGILKLSILFQDWHQTEKQRSAGAIAGPNGIGLRDIAPVLKLTGNEFARCRIEYHAVRLVCRAVFRDAEGIFLVSDRAHTIGHCPLLRRNHELCISEKRTQRRCMQGRLTKAAGGVVLGQAEVMHP